MKKLMLSLMMLALVSGVCLAEKPYTISVNQFVEHPALDAVLKGLKDYMKDNGIAVTFKVHNAQANMGTATQIAQQMIGEKADLLVAIATPTAQACAQALKKAPADLKRPFLFTAVTDPVSAGLVQDLEHPGGDITGVSDLLPLEKHLEMVMAMKPGIKNLGVLYNAGEANSRATVSGIKKVSKTMGFSVVEATASKTSEVFQAAKKAIQSRPPQQRLVPFYKLAEALIMEVRKMIEC